MSRKVDTKAEKVIVEKDGLKVQGWNKTCPVCHTRYITTSRGQKFCCPDCAKKAQTKKRKQQKEYDETKDIQRLSARAHGVGVAVLRYLASVNLREEKCEMCNATEGLECHHVNLQWLDNRPENLKWLCTKCHSKVHADLVKSEKDSEETLFSKSSAESQEIYKVILK